MKKRKVKLTLNGETLFSKGFPDFDVTLEIDDCPESYVAICTNKNVKSWNFTIPDRFTNLKEVLDVTTRLLIEGGCSFSNVTTIMCLTQIACDVVKDENGNSEEMSRRLLKNLRESDIIPEVPMIKSMMGKIVTTIDHRKLWVEGIIKCISDNIEPVLATYIKNIYV